MVGSVDRGDPVEYVTNPCTNPAPDEVSPNGGSVTPVSEAPSVISTGSTRCPQYTAPRGPSESRPEADGSVTDWPRPHRSFLAARGGGDGFALWLTISAVLETFPLQDLRLTRVLGVAPIEETVNLVMVWMLARRLAYYTLRDGMVLGATVGFGFAAFESAGYAFNAVTTVPDKAQAFIDAVNSEVIRGLLTPVGHGLRTALNWRRALGGGVADGSARDVGLVQHLGGSLRHLITGNPIAAAELQAGTLVNPAQSQTKLFGFFEWLDLLLCALIGIWLVRRMWSRGRAVVRGYPHTPADA